MFFVRTHPSHLQRLKKPFNTLSFLMWIYWSTKPRQWVQTGLFNRNPKSLQKQCGRIQRKNGFDLNSRKRFAEQRTDRTQTCLISSHFTNLTFNTQRKRTKRVNNVYFSQSAVLFKSRSRPAAWDRTSGFHSEKSFNTNTQN